MTKRRVLYGIVLLYIIALAFFFGNSYRQLIQYSNLQTRSYRVYSGFQNLSGQLNNLLSGPVTFADTGRHYQLNDLFNADSTAISNQLTDLVNTVRDTVNMQLAVKLDTVFRAELPWLLHSDIRDSLLQNNATLHLQATEYIDSIINAGLQRTRFLIQSRTEAVQSSALSVQLWLGVAMVSLAIILAVIIYSLYRQRNKADVAVREKEDMNVQFSNTLENLHEGVQIIDYDWRYIYVNDALTTQGHYPKEKMIGARVPDLYPGVEATSLFKLLEKCMSERTVERIETHFVFPDGSTSYFELCIQPVPQGIFILSLDITARKKAELELLKANRLYSVISAINQSIVHIREEEELLQNACNVATNTGGFMVACIGMLGANDKLYLSAHSGAALSILEVLKNGVDFLLQPFNTTPLAAVLRTGNYYVVNDVENEPGLAAYKEDIVKYSIQSGLMLPIKKQDKTIGVFALYSKVKDFFDEQEITLLLEAADDISFALEVMEKEEQRQQNEAELLRNERRLKKAQAIAHFGHWELEFATGVAVWSEEACRIYGLDPGDTKQSYETWKSFIHPEDLAVVMQLSEAAQQSLQPFSVNYRIVRSDGSIRYVHADTKFVFNEQNKPVGLYGITHDITEQRLTEMQVLATTDKMNEAQAIAHVGNWEIDMVNNQHQWSDEAFNMLGIKRTAPSIELFLSFIHPDDTVQAQARISEAFEKFISSSFYFRFIRKDGELRHGYIEWKFDFDKYRKPVRLYGIIKDVTEKKLAELQLQDANARLMMQVEEIKALNESLEGRVQERTAALADANRELEAFSYTVSHDLQSPLRVMRGFTNLLLKQVDGPLNNEQREMMQVIDNSARRMSELIKDLLRFSQLGRAPLDKQKIDMDELARTVMDDVRFNTPDFKATVEWNVLQPACCDTALMRQVWANLLGNAVKYSGKVDKPVVQVGMTEKDGQPVYYVKDNGAGFDMKHIDKLFGVFQRMHTLSEFEGSGVGLATVQRIIKRHGGDIWADSKVNEGATFYFTLPECEK